MQTTNRRGKPFCFYNSGSASENVVKMCDYFPIRAKKNLKPVGRLHVLPGRVNDFDESFYQRSEMLQRCLMDYFGHNLQIFPSNIDVSMVCWPNLIKLKHICISEWCIFVSTGMIKDLIQIQMMYIWCARYLARVFLFAVGSNHSCFQDLCM